MTSEIEFNLPDRSKLKECLDWAYTNLTSALSHGPAVMRLGRPTEARTVPQNKKQWPMLEDIRKHIPFWPNEDGWEMTTEDYKDLLTAALKQQNLIPGVEGGFVALGSRTSKMTKAEFCELIECYYCFGSERGVPWSEPAMKVYEEYANK